MSVATSNATDDSACVSLLLHLLPCMPSVMVPWLNQRSIPGQLLELGGGARAFVRDPAIDHPHQDETVSTLTLGVLLAAGFVALLLIESSSAALHHPDLLRSAKVFAKATLLNELLTLCSKTYCGVLRPDYYAGCGWSDALMRCASMDEDPELYAYGAVKGRLSFPSGHSSHSACCTHAARGSNPLAACYLPASPCMPPSIP